MVTKAPTVDICSAVMFIKGYSSAIQSVDVQLRLVSQYYGLSATFVANSFEFLFSGGLRKVVDKRVAENGPSFLHKTVGGEKHCLNIWEFLLPSPCQEKTRDS